MLTYDPVTSLQYYPISGGMRRFGLTPSGDSLYRVVFAPSRRYLVVGQWPDGSNYAQWVRKYKGLISEVLTDGRPNIHSNVWIMERWLTANEYHSLGKEDWDLNYSNLGPWPEKGEYELCYVFHPAPPADVSIEYRIKLIEASRKVPFGDTLRFQRADAERKKLATRAKAEDMIRNRLPAFGVNPMVGRGGGRGSKTARLLRSAEELGLPTRPGLLANGARRNNPVTRMIESAA